MKFSETWLKEAVNNEVTNNLTGEQLTDKLTMAGLELEALEPACVPFSKVFSAQIIGVEKHPNADKLKVCSVKYNNETLQIVCGDPKVTVDSVGSKVALATDGARLQDGKIKIKRSKLRGVESRGMLCSKQELGLADSSDGIWILPNSMELNLDLYQYLQLDDSIIELGLTPNRGDCFSIRGIARELAVLNDIDYKDIAQSIFEQTSELESTEFNSKTDNLAITIDNSSACPRYAGRVIRNINTSVTSPDWLKERLRRSGIRDLYPLVDVTNYVMLELGQPMHAFDLDKISEKVIVRLADTVSLEKLTLLDGKEITLNPGDLVIADNNSVLALAGVMGGENSAIIQDTQNVFLESAFFAPHAIAGRGRAHGISTDSSQRFERGVDPELAVRAIVRATELLMEIGAIDSNSQVSEVTDVYDSDYQSRVHNKTIELRYNRVERVLGISLDRNAVDKILTQLGLSLIKAELKSDNNTVATWSIPSHRFDINIEEDLLEEIARIYGYDNIKTQSPKRELNIAKIQPEVELKQQIKTYLVSKGYLETVNYSFIDDKLHPFFCYEDYKQSTLKLLNPISSEMSDLRQSLCPGLLKVAEYNFNHQVESLKLFEIGKCFYKKQQQTSQSPVLEINKLSGLLTGRKNLNNWNVKPEKFDFYDAKGDLEGLFNNLGLDNSLIKFTSSDNTDYPILTGLHPGQYAQILYNNKNVGWVANMHPLACRKLDKSLAADNSIILFELNLEELPSDSYTQYKNISKMPIIKRDLAFLMQKEIKVQQLYDIVTNIVGGLLKNITIFDVYHGTGIPEGYKSVAFSIEVQDQDKTLVDEEIVAITDKIVQEVSDKLEGRLRD